MSSPEEERAGLCYSCGNVARTRSDRGSLFYRCRVADTDPSFARYPVLPVESCRRYERSPDPPEDGPMKPTLREG